MIHFAFWGIAIALFFWFFYFSISTVLMPFPIEYREGVAQVMTQILLKGGNPFSLEYHPLAMNNYGIGYYLVVFPFARLFGNTLPIHRAVSFCCLLANLLLIAGTIWSRTKDILTAFLGGFIIAVTLAGLGGLGAFPGAMGTFLFLAAIIIPFLCSFRPSGLIASALISIAAYHTKPYFIIGFGIVAAYVFMFVSKRKGVLYSLLFMLAFSIVFIGVRVRSDAYFIDTLVSNLSNTQLSSVHMLIQLSEMCLEFLPTIVLAGILLFLNLPASKPTPTPQTGLLWRVNFSEWNTAWLCMPVNYFAFAFVVCFLIFVYPLGMHLGNYMNYAYQILLPPFILWVLSALNRKSRVSVIAFGLLLINIMSMEYILLHPDFLRQKESAGWNKLYQCINDYQRVVNSPVMASTLIERGSLPTDSGQTQYYFQIKPYSEWKFIGPGYETIEGNAIAYHSTLQDAVRSQQFDGIFITQRATNLLPPALIDEYYVRVDTITLDMPQTHQTWDIEIWEPAQE
jgi:hypothetical protein